jgi:lincosamide nucleotidyltransferase A/C/D/E
MTGAMSVEQAKAVYDLLDQNSVRCWVMGGWGVDALLGCVTREHKDLDLLVLIEDLPRYADLVRRHGFERKLVWSESQPIEIDAAPFDSAFVDAHPDGREIDVHVIDVDPRGCRHTVPCRPLASASRRRLRDGSARRRDGALRHPSRPDRHALRL